MHHVALLFKTTLISNILPQRRSANKLQAKNLSEEFKYNSDRSERDGLKLYQPVGTRKLIKEELPQVGTEGDFPGIFTV